MERNVAAARARLEAQERERLEEVEREREAAEARQRAEEERRRVATRQQQARTHRARVEVPRRSASPVASRSGAPASSARYVVTHYSIVDHGTRRVNVISDSVPCDLCQRMQQACVPRYGVRGALACERCARCKARCSHVGPLVTSTPPTNAAEWTATMCEGSALVAEATDCQTNMFGKLLGEVLDKVRGLRHTVDCMSASSASSSRGTASGADVEGDSVGGEDEDEEMGEDEDLGEDDGSVVNLHRGGGGEESSDAGEDEDGKSMEEEEDGKNNEEEEEEGKNDEEEEEEDKEGEKDEDDGDNGEGVVPETSATPRPTWRARVPRPHARAWKGKEKGKGKGKEKMY